MAVLAELASGTMEGESHAHKNRRSSQSWRRLSLVLVLTAIYMVAEMLTGWWTGSLALLADAGHMFTDVAGLVLGLILVGVWLRSATFRKTFWYYSPLIITGLRNGRWFIVNVTLS